MDRFGIILFCLAVATGLFAVTTVYFACRWRKARQEAAQNQQRYEQNAHFWKLVVDALPVHVYAKAVDNDYRYVFSNAARCRFHDKPDGFFEGKNDFDFLSPSMAAKRRAEDEAVVKAKKPSVMNLMDFTDEQGKIHHLRIFQVPCVDPAGRRLLIGSSYDVTDLVDLHRETESLNAKLKAGLNLFDTLVNNMPCYVTAKDIDNDLAYVFCNQFFSRVLGIKESEIVGKRDRDLFADQAEYAQNLEWDREAIRLNTAVEKPMNFTDRAGHPHSLQTFRIPARLMNGRNWLLIVANEVTELNQARQDAMQTAEWLRLTFNSIGDGVLTTDADGRIEMMNPVAERMLGVTSAQAAGQPHEKYFNIVSYLDDRPMYSVVTRALRTGSIIELANHTDLLSQDGKRYHISDSAAPIRDAAGKIMGAILVFRDVTEEYIQRDRLRDALFLLEFGAEQTRMTSFRMKIATREIMGSKLLRQILPVKDGRLLKDAEFVVPEDLPMHQKAFESILNHQVSANTWTYHSAFSGKLRTYRMAAAVNWDKPDEPMCYGIVQDITEIVQTATQLKNSQNLFQLAINSMPVIIFGKRISDDYRYVISNPHFTAFTGRQYEEIIGHTDQEIFNTRAEDARAYRAWDERIVADGKPVTFIEDPMNADGVRLHLRTTKIPVTGLDGEKLLLGISVDITELTNLVAGSQLVADVLKQVVVETDFSKNLDQIAKTLQDQLSPDHVIIARYRLDGHFHFFAEWHSDRVEAIPAADYPINERIFEGHLPRLLANEFIHYRDITAEVPGVQALLARHPKYPTRTLMAVPIFITGRLWGVLLVSYAWKRPFSPNDEQLMRSMANIIELARIRERETQLIQNADAERQKLLDNLDIPIVLYDNQGRIVRANQRVADEAGCVLSEMTGRTCAKIFNCTSEQYDDCPVQKVIHSGTAQVRLYQRNGKEYYVYARPVLDAAGKVVNVVRSAVDVTEINNLVKNEQVMNASLEAFIGVTDMSEAIRRVMENICKRVQATRAYLCQFDMSQQRLSCINEYLEPGREPVFCKIQNVPFDTKPDWGVAFGKVDLITMPDTRTDAVKWGCGQSWLRVRDKLDARSYYANRILVNGKLWGYVAVLYEGRSHQLQPWEGKFFASMSHVIELMIRHIGAQQQIVDALEKARAADKAKSFFIASVSHEIRTPLNAVIGFSDLMKDDHLPVETRRKYLESVSYSSNALLQLINDVLDLSKLEADQMQIVTEPTDFKKLGGEVMRVFQFRAQGNELELKEAVGEMPLLELDCMRIRQILFNLIGNAVKFTHHGSVTLRASFAETGTGVGTLTAEVADTGVGISAEDRGKLMEPFVQLSRTRTDNRATNGTGLGLAISRRLAERMGGKLWIESELGKGSTFGITLPGVKVAARVVAATSVAAADSVAEFPKKAVEALSLLLVDDVPMNLKVMEALCRKVGIRKMALATSGSEALQAVERGEVDLMLTDMWMPSMNGVELADRIRQTKQGARMKVIAVTADIEAREAFRGSSFSGVLYKPVTLQKMREVISWVVLNDQSSEVKFF